jgi:segregation and condensation protein A
MSMILQKISAEHFTGFDELFLASEGKAGVVVTFLAILELAKERLIELVQAQPYANIHIRVATGISSEITPEITPEGSQGVQS